MIAWLPGLEVCKFKCVFFSHFTILYDSLPSDTPPPLRLRIDSDLTITCPAISFFLFPPISGSLFVRVIYFCTLLKSAMFPVGMVVRRVPEKITRNSYFLESWHHKHTNRFELWKNQGHLSQAKFLYSSLFLYFLMKWSLRRKQYDDNILYCNAHIVKKQIIPVPAWFRPENKRIAIFSGIKKLWSWPECRQTGVFTARKSLDNTRMWRLRKALRQIEEEIVIRKLVYASSYANSNPNNQPVNWANLHVN